MKLILFVAYKACQSFYPKLEKNPFQYSNSILLIVLAFLTHTFQVVSLFKKIDISGFMRSMSTVQYLLVLAIPILIYYLFEFIFSKRILAKSIVKYRGTFFEKNARLLAWGYLLLNISLFIIINKLK